MKTLMPTLRECKRYIGFEILADSLVDFKVFETIFMFQLKDFIGTYGISRSGVFVIKDTYKNNKGIIRVNNKYVDHIKSVLTFIKEIDKKKVTVKSVRTSGMINKVFVDDQKNSLTKRTKTSKNKIKKNITKSNKIKIDNKSKSKTTDKNRGV